MKQISKPKKTDTKHIRASQEDKDQMIHNLTLAIDSIHITAEIAQANGIFLLGLAIAWEQLSVILKDLKQH